MRRKLSFVGKEVKPDDTIIIRPDKIVSAWEAKELHDYAVKAFPDNHVVVLPPDTYLETYDKEHFLQFLDAQRKFIEQRDQA